MIKHSIPEKATLNIRRTPVRIIVLLWIPILINIALARYWVVSGTLALSGDEPHYLIMAKALWEGELDLKHVYTDKTVARSEIGLAQRGPHIVSLDLPHWYSLHTPGLSVLLAVPFAAGGVLAARITMACIGGLLPFLFFRILRRISDNELLAAASAVVLSIGLPFSIASTMIFPEVPCAVIVLYAADRLGVCLETRSVTRSRIWLLCCWTAFLPRLHTKNIAPLAVIVAGVVVAVFRASTTDLPVGRSRATLYSAALLPVVSAILLFTYNSMHLGGGLGPAAAGQSYRIQDWLFVFLGLHLDRAQGLFVQQPLWRLLPRHQIVVLNQARSP